MKFNDDEIIALINRLLEKLHQADGDNKSSIVFNIYEKGSQHIDHVDNQYFYTNNPKPQVTTDINDHSELPDALNTEKAKVLWKKAQDVGWVDENYQPKLSRTQAALLASEMAKRLSVREKWKMFGAFWHQNKMYKYYYQAMNQKQTLDFLDEIKKLFD